MVGPGLPGDLRVGAMTTTTRWLKVAAGAAALVTATAGCGSTSVGPTTTAAPKVQCAAGSVSAAGSTFVQNLAQQWIKDYEAACPGATVNYQGVGSGAG